jgi:hypothetical protein
VEGGGGWRDSTSVQCLFAITPLPHAAGEYGALAVQHHAVVSSARQVVMVVVVAAVMVIQGAAAAGGSGRGRRSQGLTKRGVDAGVILPPPKG